KPLFGGRFFRNLCAREIQRVCRRYLHGEIVDEALEIFSPSHKIRFSINLDEHAQAPTAMNIRTDDPFLRTPCSALRSRLQTLFPQDIYGLVHDTVGGRQGLLAIHNPSPGFLAEFLDHCWGNLHETFPSTCATRRGGSLSTLTQPQGPLEMQ